MTDKLVRRLMGPTQIREFLLSGTRTGIDRKLDRINRSYPNLAPFRNRVYDAS